MKFYLIDHWYLAKFASIKSITLARIDVYRDTNVNAIGFDVVILGYGFGVQA